MIGHAKPSAEVQAWFENELREQPLRKFQVWTDGALHCSKTELRGGLHMYYIHVDCLDTTQMVELRVDGNVWLKESGRRDPQVFDGPQRCLKELEQLRDPSKWVAFAESMLGRERLIEVCAQLQALGAREVT